MRGDAAAKACSRASQTAPLGPASEKALSRGVVAREAPHPKDYTYIYTLCCERNAAKGAKKKRATDASSASLLKDLRLPLLISNLKRVSMLI